MKKGNKGTRSQLPVRSPSEWEKKRLVVYVQVVVLGLLLLILQRVELVDSGSAEKRAW